MWGKLDRNLIVSVSLLAAAGCGGAARMAAGAPHHGDGQAGASRSVEELLASQPKVTKQQADLASEMVARLSYLDTSPSDQGAYDQHIAIADQCIARAKALQQQGVPGRYLVRVDGDGVKALAGVVSTMKDGARRRYAPLSSVAAYCHDKHNALIVSYVSSIQIAASDITEVKNTKFTRAIDLSAYADPIENCSSVVSTALEKYKASPSMKVKLEGGTAVTLGEANDTICLGLARAVAKAKQDIATAHARALAAKLRPFKRRLRGGKWRLFASKGLIQHVGHMYTRRRRRLRTPRDYARASLWCVAATTREKLVPQWEVTCYRFHGNKYEGTHRDSGNGASAPTPAFR